MEEIKRQILLLGILLVLITAVVVLYKADFFWSISKGLPLHTNSGNCIMINDSLCLAEDTGLKSDYYGASSICSKRGMSLPTLEDAWSIWTASENCHSSFAVNQDVAVNKEHFKKNCGDGSCYMQAKYVNNYCTSPKIKFPLSSQYKNGSFWLKDSAGPGEHYTINYYSGRVGDYEDNISSFGVRCVSYKNK